MRIICINVRCDGRRRFFKTGMLMSIYDVRIRKSDFTCNRLLYLFSVQTQVEYRTRLILLGKTSTVL